MTNDLITIGNNGQDIVETNYWETANARAGYVFLSINAGAFRLLVPDSFAHAVPEMLSGQEAIVSRGPWQNQGGREGIEVLFEDFTDNPYAIHLVTEQCDRLPASADRNKSFTLSIWTRSGKQGEMPARFRMVKKIPWLKPWRVSH